MVQSFETSLLVTITISLQFDALVRGTMYQQHELSTTLSPEEVTRTLLLAAIPEKEEYTEDDADRFRKCRQLIEEGKTEEEVAELLGENAVLPTTDADSSKGLGIKKPKKPKKSASEPKDISELLSIACEQVGAKISLTESLRILQVCGLADQEEYNPAECDRFISACDLIKSQGQTFEQVAEYFGFGLQPQSDELNESDSSEIDLNIEEAATQLLDNGQDLVNQMMRHKAKFDAADAPTLYIKHLAAEFGSPEFQQAWHKMEDMLKAKIAGKFQNRPRKKILTGETPTLPPSPQHLTSLPPTSENGSNSD